MAEGFRFRSSLVTGKRNLQIFDEQYGLFLEQIREQLAICLEDYKYKLTEILDMNFESEASKSGSEWASLAPSTIEKRMRAGYGGEHMILQRSGRLKEAVFKAITVEMVSSGSGSELSFRVNIKPDPSSTNENGVPYIDIANWLNKGYTHAVKLASLQSNRLAGSGTALTPAMVKSINDSNREEAQVPGRQFMYITLEQKKYFLTLIKAEMSIRLRQLNPFTYEG
jgi:hypothetical protein